jgi:hypothetical protein
LVLTLGLVMGILGLGEFAAKMLAATTQPILSLLSTVLGGVAALNGLLLLALWPLEVMLLRMLGEP